MTVSLSIAAEYYLEVSEAAGIKRVETENYVSRQKSHVFVG